MQQIEQYGIFESREKAEGNATGVFTCEETRIRVKAFVLNEGEVMVRFRPERTGIWEYRIQAGERILREGSFLCIQAQKRNHGPVSAAGFGFRHADGKEFRPLGTTCYAWIYQSEEIRRQTLESLAGSPFNKVRMCVFPKDMIYNEEEPGYFPYARETVAEDVQFGNPSHNQEDGSNHRKKQ